MKQNSQTEGEIVTFLRKRDYKMVRELGQGACGKTVLLYDDHINEHFVCKKYVPYSEAQRQNLFTSFVQEIKLLHQIHHNNIVRVFNYYLYPEQFTGYILMEFVGGLDIDEYVTQHPEQVNELFLQTITGFAYLERCGILHRDIRPTNVMVRDDGTVKIIDLGFGKKIENSTDFEKSISLNWWCQTPDEFEKKRYDFRTEVYFVGMLFERMLRESSINHFKYNDVLGGMCRRNPADRTQGFSEIEKAIKSNQFFEIGFDAAELEVYRDFSTALCGQYIKIEEGSKYVMDVNRIQTHLGEVYRSFMLEEKVPDAAVVLRCFLEGTYYYKRTGLRVDVVREFLRLLKASTEEKNRIVLANLHTKLDAVRRYAKGQGSNDDIPF